MSTQNERDKYTITIKSDTCHCIHHAYEAVQRFLKKNILNPATPKTEDGVILQVIMEDGTKLTYAGTCYICNKILFAEVENTQCYGSINGVCSVNGIHGICCCENHGDTMR